MPGLLKQTVTRDSDTLALLGKKQVLKRRFGFWSLFGFAVCECESTPIIPFVASANPLLPSDFHESSYNKLTHPL